MILFSTGLLLWRVKSLLVSFVDWNYQDDIPDVKNTYYPLEDMQRLGLQEAKSRLDCGFFSVDNINALYKHHVKFLIVEKPP